MAKPYKNYLSQKDWAKYGVNPWRIDTDFDGYSDDWEIKFGYCPTAGYGARLSDSLCEKGKIDLRKGIYTAPAEVKAVEPREWTGFKSCVALVNNLNSAIKNWQAKTATALADVVDDGAIEDGDQINLSNNLKNYLANFYRHRVTPFKDGIYFSGSNTFYVNNKALDVWQKIKSGDKHLWQYDFGSDVDVNESKLVGNNLIVFGRKLITPPTNTNHEIYHTVVYVWQVNNLKKSVPAFVYEFSGELVDWSVVKNNLYLALGNDLAYQDNAAGFKQPSEFLPNFWYNDKKVGTNSSDCLAAQALDLKNNVWSETNYNQRYLQLVSLSLVSRKIVQQKFVFDSSARAFFADDRVYVFTFKPKGAYNVVTKAYEDGLTEINQFNLQNGKFSFVNNQTVDGVVLNHSNVLRQGNNLWVTTNNLIGIDGFTNKLYLLDASLNKIGWYNDFGREGKAISMRLIGKELYFSFTNFVNESPFYDIVPGQEFGFNITNPRAPMYLGVVKYADYVQNIVPINNNEVIGVGANTFASSTTAGFNDKEGVKLSWWQEQFPGENVELFETTLGSRGSMVYRTVLSSDKKYLATLVWLTKEGATTVISEPAFLGIMVYRINRNEGFNFIGGVKAEDYNTDTFSDFYFKGNQLVVVGAKMGDLDTADPVRPRVFTSRTLFWFNLPNLTLAKKTID